MLVYGLGVSGFSVADTLAELGAKVMVVAAGADELRITMVDVIGATYVQERSGEDVPHELVEFDPELIVVSPGYHPDHKILMWAAARNIPIWGDIELAWRVRDKVKAAEWLAVTGTNGKTTTVQLTAAMLAAAGYRVAPCGNIGVPVLDAVRDPQGFDVFVVELSSYQLHWMTGVHPYSSAVLNIADDHLDWHGSMESYAQAKSRIFGMTDLCIVNRDDKLVMAMLPVVD